MAKNNKILFSIFIVIGVFLILTNSCKKDEIQPKIDPTITWENPADISFGTLLSEKQLNAIANVPGTFIYSPVIGTKLNIGSNHNLNVYFGPTDTIKYNAASKIVKINVTSTTGNVVDIDNNVYNTITIGTQIWMAENLKTTKYNDGEAIPLRTASWQAIYYPVYCWYNNDEAMYKDKYGALYNWYTVNTGKLCPIGYHVPTDTEFTTLTTFLGGDSIAGGKLQEISGFAAPLGGYRNWGGFLNLGSIGYWWSSSTYRSNFPWNRCLHFNDSIVYRYYGEPSTGVSVRCIRD
jgi:uncharacterized protein (TIGR02145 family)